ncbi:MAG: helix-turn-helix domain-containing protein [Clostridia bacterium]|nr:helix-turn-helix domain-containing protein [Clostridia bacterium]
MGYGLSPLIETLLKICDALGITPNDILTKDEIYTFESEDLLNQLNSCTAKERATALKLLSVYLKSLS